MKQKNGCRLRIDPKPGAAGRALGWVITPTEAAIPFRMKVWGCLAGCIWWVYMVEPIPVALPDNS